MNERWERKERKKDKNQQEPNFSCQFFEIKYQMRKKCGSRLIYYLPLIS
jgi:hypothetical protein